MFEAVEDMGMARIYDTVSAHDIITELVDLRASLPEADHLHVALLVDYLALRPRAGEVGSCRYGPGRGSFTVDGVARQSAALHLCRVAIPYTAPCGCPTESH